MHEALQAVEENVGINVAKISAAATHSEVLWDSVNNCFVYNANGTIKYIPDSQKTTIKADEQYKYWQIVEEAKDNAIYSQYLAGDNHTEEVTVNTGFDAGKNASLKSVTYTNEGTQSVVIRTNGGDLVVNAEKATVDHYGAANYVNIEKIENESFHEHGVAAVVRIAQGHFVAEATAKVINLNVASNNVTLTENEGAKVFEYSTDSNATETIEVIVNGNKIEKPEPKDVEDLKKGTEVIAEGGVAEIDGIQFKTLQSAFDTAKDGQTVTLLEDIDPTCGIFLDKDVAIVLDLNGKKIENTASIWEKETEYGESWGLLSVQKGKLTITGNGIVKSLDNDAYAVDVRDGAECIIENGTFVGNIHAVYVQQGTLRVNGGMFRVVQKYSQADPDEFVLNCYDANYKNETAKIVVTGGTFEKFNPTNCKAEGADTNFCAEGYTVTVSQIPNTTGKDDIQYTVVKAN